MSTLAFLSPDGAEDVAVARSPMEGKAKAAGARFEIQGGWNVAVEYPGEDRAACDRRLDRRLAPAQARASERQRPRRSRRGQARRRRVDM